MNPERLKARVQVVYDYSTATLVNLFLLVAAVLVVGSSLGSLQSLFGRGGPAAATNVVAPARTSAPEVRLAVADDGSYFLHGEGPLAPTELSHRLAVLSRMRGPPFISLAVAAEAPSEDVRFVLALCERFQLELAAPPPAPVTPAAGPPRD